jgi:hypothetical protein
MCANSLDPSLRQIIDSARRSIDPSSGKNPRDTKSRFRTRQILKDRIAPISSLEVPGLLPSFRDNFEKGSRHIIALPAEDLEMIGEKWVKGIHRAETGEVLPKDAEVSVMFLKDRDATEALSTIMRFAKPLYRGPGLNVRFCAVNEDSKHGSAYAFRLWQEFTLYGFAISGE